ncbi:MAG: LysR family transcriptional regulator [Clostridia bacterium]|nr:LysR family transcriptional regulator [Clostridia bacterium]
MMKDMDMVYAIYQYGSFSKAADELYVGQSSLSMAIQRIENELGMPLFDRKHHPIQLTEAGKAYIRFYRKVKPEEENMLSLIRDLSELKAGAFALGGTHYLLSYIMQDSICRFAQQYPQVELRIVEAQSSRFKDLLADCKIDLCLMCYVDDPGLQSIGHAFYDELFLAVPKRFGEELRLPDNYLTPEEISSGGFAAYDHYFETAFMEKLPFLQLSPGNNLFSRSEMIFQQIERRPAKIWSVQQFVTAYNLADAGLGCTLTSAHMIQGMKKENLVYYTLPSSLMKRDFHFVTRKDAYISKAIRSFCAIFSENKN